MAISYCNMRSLLFIIVFLTCTNIRSEQADEPSDPIKSMVMIYQEESNDIRNNANLTEKEREQWMRKWKQKFLSVIKSNPKTEYTEIAKIKLLGLCNSLGDFDDSVEVLSELTTEADNTQKIRWLNEAGEAHKSKAMTENNAEAAQKSLESFSQSQVLYLSLSADSLTGELQGRQAIALSMAGDVAKNILDDNNKAAEFYNNARVILQQSTEGEAFAAARAYDVEVVAENEMTAYLVTGNVEKALSALNTLSSLSSYQWPPSTYALNFATLRFDSDPDAFQGFISDWQKNHSYDERTPILLEELANSYYNTQKYELAFALYQEIHEKHAEAFRTIEADAIRSGTGGHYERVLLRLGELYNMKNDPAKAKKVQDEFLKLYSKSKSVVDVSVDYLFHEQSTPAEIPMQKTRFFRVTLMLAGILLIFAAIYFFSQKRIGKTK